ASVGGQRVPSAGFWATPLADGLAVVILSPGRGLLFYSPVFALAFIGLALALFPLADSIGDRRALAAVFAVLTAWSITANSFGAFIGYRGWNRWALANPETRLWLWGDNPVVDPLRSIFDSVRIALAHSSTSRNSPDLLDAGLSVRSAPSIAAVPGAPVRVYLDTANTGKAVWLTGRSPDERGVVSLGCEWRRDGSLVGDSEARRELHLSVFPGDSMDL